MAYIGRQLARGENKLFDDISSSFNGSTTTFNLTVSSIATSTATPFQLFVSLGGVMQKPNTDFTTAGNQITFTTAPAAGLSCWIMMQGDTIDQAAIPDSSVTPSKISGSNFAFSGDLRLNDADSSNYVGFKAPTTVSSNVVWTLPAADTGVSGYVLSSNGSGVLSWVESGDNSSPSFTGDVTLTDDGALVGTSSFNATYTGSVKTYTVTVASKSAAHRYNGSGSGSGYKINGKESPFLTLTPGRTYKFDQADGSNSGHPLRFYLEANKTTAYTTGVTTNGTAGNAGAYTQIVVSDTTPQVLHYQCSAHALMGNAVQTNSNVAAAGSLNGSTLASSVTASSLTSVGTLGSLAVTNNVTVGGNFTVSGTTTTVDSVTLSVKDKNIEMGVVSSPSDTTADGGGLTLKGASDKTFNWVNSTDAWTSSEHIHLLDNKKLFVGGASGTTDGLEIYHDSNNSFIKDSGTGRLTISTNQLQLTNAADSAVMIRATQAGAVEIFENGTKRLETTTGGINVTGAINVNGSPLSAAPTIELTANGSVSANAGVIVNASGQVEGLSGAVAATGSIVQWESGTAPQQTSCKLADGKYIIVYSDVNNSEHGTAVLVTTSGTTVTAHSGAVFSANQTLHISCCRVSDTQFAILYYDDTNNYFKVRLGTVSGTSISYGSENNTSKGGTPGTRTSAIGYQSDVGGLLICLATSNTGSYSPAYTQAHISGTSIVFSNAGWGTVRSGQGHDFNIVENTTDNELLFTWISTPDQNGGRSRTAKLAGSSNHTVTWGQDEYISNQNQYDSKVCYNADDNVYAYVFRNQDQSNKIGQCCGTPSGSGGSRAISWTSYQNVYTSSGGYPAIAYSTTASRYLIIYADNGNTGSMILYKQSGTSIISDGSSVVTYQPGANVTARTYQSVVDIGGGKFGITFPYGTGGGRTFARQLSTTNLTAFNFLGFSSAAYTNGQTATINVVGNTISGQSSLTPGAAYFVAGDGSLSTTEGSPSVKAGVALSSTKILIRQ